jgi:hypothetical protein
VFELPGELKAKRGKLRLKADFPRDFSKPRAFGLRFDLSLRPPKEALEARIRAAWAVIETIVPLLDS